MQKVCKGRKLTLVKNNVVNHYFGSFRQSEALQEVEFQYESGVSAKESRTELFNLRMPPPASKAETGQASEPILPSVWTVQNDTTQATKEPAR